MIELSSTFFVICVCGVLEASKVAVFMKGENDDEGRVLSGISLKIFSRNPIQNNDKTMKGESLKICRGEGLSILGILLQQGIV